MEQLVCVNNVCRTCLAQEGEFHSVFVPDENSGLSLLVADIIMSYTSLQIAVGDGLPDQICTVCASTAVHLYLFKQRCQESDSILRQQYLGKLHSRSSFNEDVSENQYMEDNKEKLSSLVNAQVKECLFSCDVCLKTFNEISDLDHHLKSDHDDLIAAQKLIIEPDLIPDVLIAVKSEEIVKVSSQNRLKCQECNKAFRKPSHLKRHVAIHSSVKAHYCKDCNKGFTRQEQYYSHMNAHSGIKPHVCPMCNKGFNQVSNLKDHMRTHNGEKPFLCSVCGKGFNQLGNLRQHTVRHTGVKSHICSTCGNGFASKGELCAHLRKHTGARPFICAICSHGFTTSSSLTKHKRIHSGEKPYECGVCKMKFSRSGILARHKRTHTGEKPYVCEYCSKAFSQSNDLCSHLRIHTGEKPYICDVCGQAFRQSSALKTHKKTHADRGSVIDSDRTRHNFVPSLHHNSFLKNEFNDPYEEIKFSHLNQTDFIAKF